MEPVYDITPHALLLDRIQKDGAGRVVGRIAARTYKSMSSKVREILCGYEDFFAQLASRIRRHGRLRDEDYTALKRLFDEIQVELGKATGVDILAGERDGHGEMTLRALHLLGGLEVQDDCRRAALFVSPKMLTRALSFASLLNSHARAKHVEAIAKIRGDSKTAGSAAEQEKCFVERFATDLRNLLRETGLTLKPALAPRAGMEAMLIEYLPTSSDFYEAGVDYYRDPAGSGRNHYILATTSGILLPQDYYGSAYFRRFNRIPELAKKSDKNPWREKYFRALADTRGGPRHYYFEIDRARRSFGETLRDLAEFGSEGQSRQYIDDSRKTIARFLRIPGFGLYGLEQFPHEFDHLTLGNGRQMLLSLRDSDKRNDKIGHGLWVRPARDTAEELRRLVEAFEFRDMVTGALLGGAAYGLGYKTHSDARLALVEAFVGAFVVPFVIALRQVASLKQVRDEVLDVGHHIKESLPGEPRFTRHPGDCRLSEGEAMKKAEEILTLLMPADGMKH